MAIDIGAAALENPQMDSDWKLDAQIAGDTAAVGDLPLCTLRAMDEATYPWLVLVPRRAA